VRRFADKITAASWGGFAWRDGNEEGILTLPEDYADYTALCARLQTCDNLRDVAAALS
jgi:hypothetical protein